MSEILTIIAAVCEFVQQGLAKYELYSTIGVGVGVGETEIVGVAEIVGVTAGVLLIVGVGVGVDWLV